MNETMPPGDAQSAEFLQTDEPFHNARVEQNEIFESAKRCVEEIEGRFGAHSLVLADELDAYARVLRQHKGSLLEAFSAESRAKAIRSHFTKDALHDEIAVNLKKRAKREESTQINEPLICLIVCLILAAVGFLAMGPQGAFTIVLLTSGTWFKTIQWRISRLWCIGGLCTLGLTDIVFVFTRGQRLWMSAVLQVVSMAILGLFQYQQANTPANKDAAAIAAKRDMAAKQLQRLSNMFQR